MKKFYSLLLTLVMVLGGLALASQAWAVDANGKYLAGQTYDGGIDGNVTQIDAGEPATEKGQITGADTVTHTINGEGTLSLRGDNYNFAGNIVFESGTLNLYDRLQFIKYLSNFTFNGAYVNASDLTAALDTLKTTPTIENKDIVLSKIVNLTYLIPTLSWGTALNTAIISFNNNNTADLATNSLTIAAGKAARFDLTGDSKLTFENFNIALATDARVITVRTDGILLLTGDDGTQYIFQNNKLAFMPPNVRETGLINNSGHLLISNIHFINNRANYGSPIYNAAGKTISFFGTSNFENNMGNYSGVIHNDSGGILNFFGPANFINNSLRIMSDRTGAIYNAGGTINFFGEALFSGNVGRYGGAMYLLTSSNSGSGAVTFFEKAVFEQNSINLDGVANGGAINLSDGTLTFKKGVIFLENKTLDSGGAIYAQPTLATYAGVINLYGNSSFVGNVANINGQAMYHGGALYLGNYMTLNVNLAEGEETLFSGNTANGVPNSIYFSTAAAGQEVYFNLTTAATNSVLTMHDPMAGAVSNGLVSISMTGPGRWDLGGDSSFSGDGLKSFSIGSGSTLYLYREGEVQNVSGNDVASGKISLLGNSTSNAFNLAIDATLGVGGGNVIATTDGTISLNLGSTLAFNLVGFDDSGVPMLRLDGTIDLPGSGKISLDLLSMPEDDGFYEYTLVQTKDNYALTATNFNQTVTYLGENLNPNRYKVTLTFVDNLIKAGLSVQDAFSSAYLVWTGQKNSTWEALTENWLDDGIAGKFTAGDIVNFDNDGAFTDIDLGPGITAAGVYVRGGKDYSFNLGSLSIDSKVGGWSNNTAASGKLVLGAFARGANDVVITNFNGTLDLTATTGNSFENGIDLYSGRLLISKSEQLGGNLDKVGFQASRPVVLVEPINDLIQALTKNSGISEALAEYVRIIALARQNGSLPALLIKSNVSVSFNGNNSNEQRLNLADGKSGAIQFDSNAILYFETNKADNGGALNIGEGSLFSLIKGSGWGSFIFTNNQATENGGAISNQGLISMDQVHFESNKAINGNGGAIYNDNGQILLINGNSLKENTAEKGGAIFSQGADSHLYLEQVEFYNNSATIQGGAIYLGTGGSASINLADNLTTVYFQNYANGLPNSIYFAGNNVFNVNLGGQSRLEILDPMSGEGKIDITQKGTGIWALGGETIFTGETTFSVNGGTLLLLRASEMSFPDGSFVQSGKINLSSESSFNLASGAVLELRGGNSITAGKINLATGSTLAFHLNTNSTSPVLTLTGTTAVTGTGKIQIDFASLSLTNAGLKYFTLVDSSNGAFTAQNVNTTATLRGEEITAYSLGGGSLDITIDGGDIKAVLDLKNPQTSEILTWLGSGISSGWNITAEDNWKNSSSNPTGFMHGDIVNFDGTGTIPTGIALNP
ncbi:MAG: hypothetical protein LBF38_02660, partial [Deltaproteobacteria bacterium]|nr:hypothetical protein [Deltaproteobacteria bacterium]